jgi:hypothetical protein
MIGIRGHQTRVGERHQGHDPQLHLKPSPAESNTEALARVVIDALEGAGVNTDLVRVADFDVKPGITDDEAGRWPTTASPGWSSPATRTARIT